MAPRGQGQRRDEQPAYVLHTYAYRETSLIIEAYHATWGRVALVARGAKRPRSELRGRLQRLGGPSLLCGVYLNELLLKLLPREDPHPQRYAVYEAALQDLAAGSAQAPVLRRFELELLSELGYALPLDREAGTGAPIDPAARYHYVFDRGPQRLAAAAAAPAAPEPRRGAPVV